MYAERLKKLRKEMKLTQQELADRLCISRSTYGQYEINRREPNFKTITQLADIFNVSVDYILGRENRAQTLAANTINPGAPANDPVEIPLTRGGPAQTPAEIPVTRKAPTHNVFALKDAYLHINTGGKPLTPEALRMLRRL